MGKSVQVQQAYRFRNDDGNETGASFMGTGNNQQQILGTGTANRFRVRLVAEETGGGTLLLNGTLYYSHEGGTYTPVSISSSVIRSVSSLNDGWTITDNDPTTQQLGYSGTFTTGRYDDDGAIETGITISSNYTEVEFCIYVVDADVNPGDTIDLRVYDATAPITSYAQTARLIVEKNVSQSITANATIEKAISQSFTADAWISVGAQQKTGDFTADAVIEKQISQSVTADAVIERQISQSVTADAIIERLVEQSVSADAIIKKAVEQSVSADAIIKGLVFQSVSADAIIEKSQSQSVTVDAIVKAGKSGSITAEAWIEAAGQVVGDFTADAIIKKGQSQSIAADAIIKKALAQSVTVDAIIMRGIGGSVAADAIIEKQSAGSITVDAVISCVGKPVWVSPANMTPMSETPALVFTIPDSPHSMHFRLELDKVDTFDGGDYEVHETWVSTTGWEYWDGDSWEPFPSGGVANTYSGNECRYTIQSALSAGTWYRRVTGGQA